MRWIYPVVLLMIFGSAVDAQTKISFDELETLLKSKSPRQRIINNDYLLMEKMRDIDLQWSNPEFEFETERMKLDSERESESLYKMHKSFELPWVYSKRKDVWGSKLKSASYEKENNLNSFLAEMKTGYIELSLLDAQREDVLAVKSMLEKISETASLQLEEGAISGFEQNLIQMSLTSVETAIIELMARKMSLESEWKTSAGIEKSTKVELTTPVTFQIIQPELLDEVIAGTDKFSGIKAHKESVEALKNDMELEGMSFLPEISLGGGYKEASNGLKGFVLGVSVPIPLLNQNGARKELKEIELEQFEEEFAQYKDHVAGEAAALCTAIESYEKSLRKYFDDEDKLKMGLDQISASYNEGWISLSDMLNAVSIYFGYIEAVNAQLNNYYQAVFNLESISGKSLVTF